MQHALPVRQRIAHDREGLLGVGCPATAHGLTLDGHQLGAEMRPPSLTFQAARAERDAAHEAHAALLARRAPLAARLSFEVNNAYPCSPELRAMPFHEAARSAYALDRELVASQRRINVAYRMGASGRC